jgi:excisionase family DNA binding protein
MEKLYTLKEAREILRVCTKTIQRWDKEGKIKCIRTPGNRRLIPESEILRIIGKIDHLKVENAENKSLITETEPKKEETVPKTKIEPKEIKIEETAKIEKPVEPIQEAKESPEKSSKPKEMTRYEMLDALEPPGLAIRAAFGDLLSAAILLKKFTGKDLSARARCPESVVNLFCQRMLSLGYVAEKNGVFELLVEVIR